MNIFRFPIVVIAVLALMAMPTASRAQIPIEEIALSLLGDRFGIAPEQVSGFLGRSDLSVFDAAPYYATSYYTDNPVDEVWRLREQGLGWGEVAHRLGMHPGTFNKLRKSGAFDRDEIWEDICEDRYGLRESDYDAIRRRGGTIRDALPAAIIARSSRIRPLSVYERYRAVRNWDKTANYYRTNLRDHRRFAGRGSRPAKSGSVMVSDAKSKTVTKGRAYRAARTSRPTNAKNTAESPNKRKGIGQSNAKHGTVRARGKSTGTRSSLVRGKSGSKGQGKGQN